MKFLTIIQVLLAQNVRANGEYPAGNAVVEFLVDVNKYIYWP